MGDTKQIDSHSRNERILDIAALVASPTLRVLLASHGQVIAILSHSLSVRSHSSITRRINQYSFTFNFTHVEVNLKNLIKI